MPDTGKPIKVMLIVPFPIERLALEHFIKNSAIPMQIVASLPCLKYALPLLHTIKPGVLLLDADVGQYETLKALRRLRHMSPMKTLVLIQRDEPVFHQALATSGAHQAVSKTMPMDVIIEMIVKVHTSKYEVDKKPSFP